MTKETAWWTCIGLEHGKCGIKHKSKHAAQRCCDAYRRKLKRDERGVSGRSRKSLSDRRQVNEDGLTL